MAAKTFAQQAKIIMNKYKLRLGDKFDKSDPLALAAMNAELSGLQKRQEETRINELPKGDQPLAQQFAKGGTLPQYQGPGELSQFLNQNYQAPFFSGADRFQPGVAPQLNVPTGMGSIGAFQSQQLGPGLNRFNDSFNLGSDPADFASLSANDTGIGEGVSPVAGDSFKSRVPWMGAAAGVIGGLLANRKLDLPSYDYEEYKPTQTRAHLVDYSRGREQTLRERDQAQALITRSARGTGSQAGLMENILAGATGTQRIAGQQFGESLETEANINAQIRNQVAQANAQQQMQAAQINMRNKLYSTQLGREDVLFQDQRRRGRIGAITGAVTGYAKDRLAASQYDQMINMMAPDNYSIQADKDSLFRRLFQISPEQKISFKNTGDQASNI